MTWREKARPVIQSVIEEIGTDDMKTLRKALSEAYPFWEKENYPYKVWLDEIKKQLSPAPPTRKELQYTELELVGQQRLL